MSRNFNHRNRSRRLSGRSWGTYNRRPCYPPGLRGAEIGLYFRGLQNKKLKRETIINLRIPHFVLSTVDSNLKCIAKIAARQSIILPKSRISDIFKNNSNIKEEIEEETNEEMKEQVKDGIKEEMREENSEETDIIDKSQDVTIKQENEDMELDLATPKSSELDSTGPKTLELETPGFTSEAGPSKAPDYIQIKFENESDYGSDPKQCALRKLSDYKYSYDDIITGTFDEKLDECLAKGVSISLVNCDIENLNMALFVEYEDMLQRSGYKNMLHFRKKLPTYIKTKEIMDVINKNQVIVISGETGCGKSTQVPQIILDEAICAKKGANVKILVTQPRRIAASSLAIRVSKERGENLGNSVGYAVRLEKVVERSRGSIQYCTTGILLAELETNQGMTEYSHIILDEVHERDVHIDLSMCMLKQVLKKRKDLKLILMSATIDANILSSYFDNCPLMHIEGLAYPVKDLYLEEILSLTKYRLPPEQKTPKQCREKKNKNRGRDDDMERDIKYKHEISSWLESKKKDLDYNVYKILQDSRIEEFNIDLILELLIHICKREPGAILVFLPGLGEITKLIRTMNDSGCFPSSNFEVYPLHSKLPTLEQHKIFERPREHIRKIIIATNIAETSITIDDIVYVVDCGKMKITGINIEQNISTLKTQWVSQANLRQRRGRAGRCQPGICYHLITSYRAAKIEERTLPELQRSNLLEPVLMIKKLRLGLAADALKLVPSPPADTTIKWAVKHLQRCGALDDAETLTPLGWHLARLPVHPAAGKLLLFGALFGCLDRAASVAAVWGFKDPFMLVIGKEREIDIKKRNLALGEPSDHIAISEAVLRWETCPHKSRRSFAYDHFLSNNTLELLSEMKHQLADNLRQMGFLPSGNIRASWENRNANNLSLFKAIVAASLYPNIAYVRWNNLRNIRKPAKFTAYSPEDGKISIHPSSIMSAVRSGGRAELCSSPGANWLVYWLKQRTSDLFILDVTLIYTLPLLFFGEFAVSADVEDSESCLLSISTTKVRCKKESANKLSELRSLLDKVLASKITDSSNNSVKHNEFEEQVLNTVIQLITAEDEQAEYLSEDFADSDNSESDSDRK